MRKFKTGQMVKLINPDGMSASYGATGRVNGYTTAGNPHIVWIQNNLTNLQMDGGYWEKDFILLKDADWDE